MLNHRFHRVHLPRQVNLLLPNHLSLNHHFLHITIAVPLHPINILYHIHHFSLIRSTDHHLIPHSIVCYRTTTVMVLLDHLEKLAMNNNIKIFFMIVFFKWLPPIDNNIYPSMAIHHPMGYGVQLFDLLLVSTQVSFLQHL